MASGATVLADGGSNFLVPNATFFAELFAFLVILFLLRRYVLPPIQKALTERQEIIAKQMEDAEETKPQLAAAQSEYQQAMTEAASRAAQVREEARADAAAIREEMLAKAREEADRIIAAGVSSARVSVPTTRPSRNTTARSAHCVTSFRRCVMKMIPTPSALSPAMTRIRRSVSVKVRLEVGSSMMTRRALSDNALMISTS